LSAWYRSVKILSLTYPLRLAAASSRKPSAIMALEAFQSGYSPPQNAGTLVAPQSFTFGTRPPGPSSSHSRDP
jgi:hypothetical protein